ncbi:MAG: hypothetical protein PVF51_11450 [Nitrospirota bacterium]
MHPLGETKLGRAVREQVGEAHQPALEKRWAGPSGEWHRESWLGRLRVAGFFGPVLVGLLLATVEPLGDEVATAAETGPAVG